MQHKTTKMFKAMTKTSAEMYRSKLKIKTSEISDAHEKSTNPPPTPLKNFSLRGNQLCGSILIGNYNYLTQLEVSENEMEVLDLSSLAQLETLKCSRNKLTELMINGSNLTSVIADHNGLHSITVTASPEKLIHLDISYNDFTQLPIWIANCTELQTLKAHNNQLLNVTDFFTSYQIKDLKLLNLAYNNLRVLNRLPEKISSIEELYLQSNELHCMPENFLGLTQKRLRVLNLACNKLTSLSTKLGEQQPWATDNNICLETLMLSSNNLTDTVFETLFSATNLRVLHLAYNKISELPESCLRKWTVLEVLVLSGNLLQQLPECITDLKSLQVLRVHSNLLLSTPMLSKLNGLKALDLAHNHLDRINLLNIMPKQLKYLDLSCNMQLQVDERQVKVCQSERKWSLVDVSGKNRACLPTTRLDEFKEKNCSKPPWNLGFSETPGDCRKLYVSQLRLASFRNEEEGLFGIFECKTSSVAVKTLAKLIPKLLQQERMVKETSNEYMKYTLLAAHQKVNGMNESHCCVGATLCHIVRENNRPKDFVRPHKTKRYVLRVASGGNVEAYLVRKTTNVRLTATFSTEDANDVEEKIANFPDPVMNEIPLTNEDEYLIICNSHLWRVMSVDRVAREVRKEENPILAAKRIQDIAQSFGATENLSVIVVKFRNIGTDVDRLIKELKKTVRKKPVAPLIPNCCERNQTCRHRIINPPNSLLHGQQQIQQQPRQLSATRSDRSSPSGQSDQALSPLLCKDGNEGDGEFVLAHARILEEENKLEMLDETDSALSEEQFKCWEYMLEQNTQLLFDKELNTISKSFTKNRARNIQERKLNRTPECLDTNNSNLNKSNLLRNINNKILSSSSPQLLYSEVRKPFVGTTFQPNQTPQQPNGQQHVSFLSKHFGSTRSFQNSNCNVFDSRSRDSLAVGAPYSSKLSGGPNAAYFGSLQRLMPYNLEYDFAVMQERGVLDEDDEYLEHESRMRNYWGVATTEL